MRATIRVALVFIAFWSPAVALAQAPTMDDLLQQADAVGEPPFDAARKAEPGYLDSYRRSQHELYRRRADLMLRACRMNLEDPRVPDLMNRRWELLAWNQDPAAVADEVLADIDAVLRDIHDANVVRHGAYWRAHFLARQQGGDSAAMRDAVIAFVDAYRDDERGASLLALIATDESASKALRIDSYRRLGEQYPSSYMGQYAAGAIRCLEAAGQPFELAFDDAISGRHVSIADLRGKVIVLDFWSTRCGPCVAEMPQLKQIYETYRDRGVEFIGVSLDEAESKGGLTALRDFVRKHEIPWPQYYQGDGYESEFSTSWGISGIPVAFVIDKAGRLRSSEARGKLEDLLPALLAE